MAAAVTKGQNASFEGVPAPVPTAAYHLSRRFKARFGNSPRCLEVEED